MLPRCISHPLGHTHSLSLRISSIQRISSQRTSRASIQRIIKHRIFTLVSRKPQILLTGPSTPLLLDVSELIRYPLRFELYDSFHSSDSVETIKQELNLEFSIGGRNKELMTSQLLILIAGLPSGSHLGASAHSPSFSHRPLWFM